VVWWENSGRRRRPMALFGRRRRPEWHPEEGVQKVAPKISQNIFSGTHGVRYTQVPLALQAGRDRPPTASASLSLPLSQREAGMDVIQQPAQIPCHYRPHGRGRIIAIAKFSLPDDPLCAIIGYSHYQTSSENSHRKSLVIIGPRNQHPAQIYRSPCHYRRQGGTVIQQPAQMWRSVVTTGPRGEPR
jgi:hypothetical protein